MTEYRTPLPRLLAASLEVAVNQVLELDPDSAARMARLEGRCLQVDLSGLAITLYFIGSAGRIRVALEHEGRADTVVRGSPVSLLSMAVADSESGWNLPEAEVEISGDANLARDLERVFGQLDPDWEGRLAAYMPDTLAHQLAVGVRQGTAAGREAARNAGDLLGHWLGEESGAALRQAEFRPFTDEVDALRERADRFAARLALLRRRHGSADGGEGEEPGR